MNDTTETKPESPQPPLLKSGTVRDTPRITFVPQKTAAQRLYVFTQQLARLGPTPEFFLNKAFDYTLSLPEVYKLKSTAERMEAATALLLEVTAMHTEEIRAQGEAHMEHPEPVESSEEEVVATA